MNIKDFVEIIFIWIIKYYTIFTNLFKVKPVVAPVDDDSHNDKQIEIEEIAEEVIERLIDRFQLFKKED